MEDLVLGRQVRPPKVYRHQIANNVIAQVDEFEEVQDLVLYSFCI